MSQFSFENQPESLSSQEELSRLKEATMRQVKSSKEAGIELEPQQAAREAIKQYLDVPRTEALSKEQALKEAEVKALIEGLTSESHDAQVAELAKIMNERGIRNALQIADRMNNPHLFDDFCRYLAQFIVLGNPIPDLKEKDELWKPLHMTLFEVSFPEAGEEEAKKRLKELISGMEQFYAGMLSATSDKKNPGWFSVEVVNANGSEEVIFYVSVPTEYKALFEKQLSALFPGARASEHHDDFNIFNESGAAAASYAALSKPFLYPLKPYDEFDVDPLGSILNGFSKIDRVGEGAAIQFIIGSREDGLVRQAEAAIEKIRKGKSVGDALKEINQSIGGAVAKEFLGIAKAFVKAPGRCSETTTTQKYYFRFRREQRC